MAESAFQSHPIPSPARRGTSLRTAPGIKTSKMLEVERRIGRTLEEDFREYYVLKGWGYRRLAKRWGVGYNTICTSQKRNRQRSWVEMSGLPARREPSDRESHPVFGPTCGVCSANDVGLDDAHWVARRDGGSRKPCNVLHLCPTCHRKLDRDDPATIELC